MVDNSYYDNYNVHMSLLFSTSQNDTGAVIKRRHTRELIYPACQKDQGRVKIGFTGLSAGAGATTLCFAAAEYLASVFSKQKDRSVTMLELDVRTDAPAGRPYDKIGIDRRFAGRDFISLYRLAAEGKPLRGVRNIDGGVSWALRLPSEHGPAPDPTTLHRLMNNTAGDILLCDISAQGILNAASIHLNRDALKALLADLDHIVCVFDPLPSRLLASVPAAEVCRAAEADGVPVTWVFNKLNPGVNMREAMRFTGIKDHVPFPAVSAEAVYSAEFACRSLASEPEIKAALSDLFAG